MDYDNICQLIGDLYVKNAAAQRKLMELNARISELEEENARLRERPDNSQN